MSKLEQQDWLIVR